ncbi:UPF0182 family protein [Naasia sp. SYSU D00057]|uniref:UPF0182 family membrane protein n=1 Tax=Naasia sp. SYSU D00057 TaxID=2817380 RepID=UPI001B312BBE|nr:UPF0182 family protein [Naasia sp. SYSU D00057]
MTTTAAAPRRRNRATLAITAGIVAGLLILFFIFAGLYADILWFDQLGFLNVLLTQWGWGIGLFFAGFLGMAVPVFLSIYLAYRFRPIYARLNSQLDRYQQVIEPLRRLAMLAVPGVLGLFAGVSAATRWQTVLLYLNRTPSDAEPDPQFGLNISFYLFDLPFLHGLVGFASAVVLVAGIAGIATTYLYGALRVTGREVRLAKAARVQIAVTAAIYLALQAVSIYLDQFLTLSQTGSLITGASYADVNGTIPARVIISIVAGLVALLFIVTAIIGRWRLPVIGTVLLIITSLVAGSIYPWVVQRFQVDPSELSLERPYIQKNIDQTRVAYGVDDVQEIPYEATTEAEPGALRADAETTANIRILDPAIVSPSFGQLQQFRQYYAFARDLDVDRYEIDGQTQDTVVAVRELNQDGLGDGQTWYNRTVVYTHGYGVVAAYGNQRSADGQPVFLESGIPTSNNLGDYEPRIYFGENSPAYSIVGAPEGTEPIELDYPSGGGDAESDANQVYTTFDGDGGPQLNNWFTRLIYALKFQSEQVFLSNAVNNESQILYDRDPKTRVEKVAPYLTLDSDAYPAVVDGRIQWIIDGYTTSSSYPYSSTRSLSESIADTYTPAPAYAVDDINYIRNAVKATVDAYSGEVTLYAWDQDDPIIQSWQKVFPNELRPMTEMSAELMSHVRYPADLFKVQRSVLGQYHVEDAGSWYQRDNAWRAPNDPTSPASNPTLQPPYYLTMQIPESDGPSYTLYSTFIPNRQGAESRSILTGYLAVDSDAGATKGEVAEGYGALRLLTLPNNVPGPGQVQNAFNSDTDVANQLALLTRGDTSIDRGNLLTLPVGGGLLYVQPVYVRSSGETAFPLLRKVLVSFGDQIAFEDTLDQALDQLFGGDSGADAGDTDVPPETDEPATDGGTDTPAEEPTDEAPTTPTTPSDNPELQQALEDANQALQDREAAYRSNDLVAAAEADARLQDAVERALAASGG